MQNIDELVDLHECPLCEGGSILDCLLYTSDAADD